MHFADEDLREGRAGAGAVPHLLAQRRILRNIELRIRSILARQQRLGGAAIAAARAGVDVDRDHVGPVFTNTSIIWGLCGGPQPARTPARRPAPPWRAAAPGRRRRWWRPTSGHRRPAPRGGPESRGLFQVKL